MPWLYDLQLLLLDEVTHHYQHSSHNAYLSMAQQHKLLAHAQQTAAAYEDAGGKVLQAASDLVAAVSAQLQIAEKDDAISDQDEVRKLSSPV